MKKYLFWLATIIVTFFLGLSAFVLYYFRVIPEIAKPSLNDEQKTFDCIKVNSFPGLAAKISEIKAGQSGYFPKDTFSGGWENADAFINDWYGKHLKAMDEKSLLGISNENAEVYRFLWLRTFHHPIFVRVVRGQNEVELFTKEFDGAGGYEPGKVLRINNHILTKDEWCEFLALLEKANYWKLPTKNEISGGDGAQWILEAVKSGRYHAVDRWSPEKGEYRKVCVYLLKLSGVEVDKLKDDLY